MATATANYAMPKVERNAPMIKRAKRCRFLFFEIFCTLFDALLHKKQKLAVLHTLGLHRHFAP
jgi:hypothetical protein